MSLAIADRKESEPNWRRSYHDLISIHRADLRKAREQGDGRPRFAFWRRWVPKDLTDEEIDTLSRRLAERHVERAIIEHNRKLGAKEEGPRHARPAPKKITKTFEI